MQAAFITVCFHALRPRPFVPAPIVNNMATAFIIHVYQGIFNVRVWVLHMWLSTIYIKKQDNHPKYQSQSDPEGLQTSTQPFLEEKCKDWVKIGLDFVTTAGAAESNT